jgi:poly-gamma-glutamate capsule biosynthesis protein CapA/YwtB (metallophosphatase superfamily)
VSDDLLKIALSGDAVIMRPNATDDKARHGFVELVQSADVAFTQLDILLNDFRGPPAPGIGIHISASPQSGQELLSVGFNLFSAAGNHVLDYGVEGLRRHVEALRELSMSFAGVGETAAEAAEPAFVEVAGGRVALVAAASSLGAGWPAADPSSGIEGRPGVNALRFHTRYLLEPETFAQVRRVARVLGAEERERYELQMGYVPALANAETELRLLDGVVERASERRIVTEPQQDDLERITTAIREARGNADVVIVALHTHEYDDNDERPAQFARTFAHACVDAGAHVVAMSGAHVLRGIELYRGSPIFYGLGNVWFEYELLERLPRDALDYYGLPADATPEQFADNAMLGFQRDARFWESLLPLCSFAGGELESLALHPITLGFGRPRGRRGQPELAAADGARRILSRLATLSRPFGTHLDETDHGTRVRLDEQRDGKRRRP